MTGPLPANTNVPFTVNGAVGIPSTGVAAIVATVTVINSNTVTGGTLQSSANVGGIAGPVSAVLFEASETLSNSVVIEDGTDGKIKLYTSVSVDVVVDVQGYFTVGNGNPAPGGFVPVAAANVTTINAPAAGSTSTVQVTGVAGVPSTASAVYANLTLDNTGAGSIDSWLIPFAAGTTPPATSLNYHAAGKSALGTTVDLNAQGQMSIKFDSVAAPLSVKVDVLGYFDGQPSNAGYTPLSARVYDTSTNQIPAGTTVDVPVNG